MKRISLIILLVLALLSPIALACHPQGQVTTSHTDHGHAAHLTLLDEHFVRAPLWAPLKDMPLPISPGEAVELVRDWVLKAYKTEYDAKVDGISFSKMQDCKHRDHWVYQISFEPIEHEEAVGDFGHIAAVFLDGTVVGGYLIDQ